MSEKIDSLGRILVVNRLKTVAEAVKETEGSFSVALNGEWGSGKSFVLDMLEDKLKTEDGYRGNYVVFHYNCWQYDYYEEPLEAIIAAISDAIDEEIKVDGEDEFKAYLKKFLTTLKNIFLSVVADKIKDTIKFDLVDAVENGIAETGKIRNYDSLFSLKKTVTSVQSAMSGLTDKYTVVLVVDELDRCLPEYAIKVLERLHHLFYGQKNMMMLLAVDKSQLERTVHNIFGENTSTDGYLKKFIDFEIELPIGTTNERVLEKYKDYFDLFDIDDNDLVAEYFSKLFAGINIRTQEKLINRVETVHKLSKYTKAVKKNTTFMLSELTWAVLTYYDIKATPFSITHEGLRMTKQLFYDKAIGKNRDALQDFSDYINKGTHSTLFSNIVYATEALYGVDKNNRHGHPINDDDVAALINFRDLFAIIR